MAQEYSVKHERGCQVEEPAMPVRNGSTVTTDSSTV